ncbi:hypothetical protein [Nostoc sp. 'Peltigera malacea cyanobiont' DB3992]|uniref:hypothetical protein n=1 Tax=Nostoc sp. 'Peltigera malacea cyanobiont' DB3992 TaxID=1206980 RepID=UPI000C050917|nr:hypothetical protein [Nostoc sp. 'Peltigera malacea cyanobiont' DB3992]PHM06880.1 hypothetical protein CK516_30580 [Nostoc sp. 'Peltigera malacea cyanobiont' DB3992]
MLRGSDDELQELKAMPTATRSRSVSDRRSGNALEHWYDYLPNIPAYSVLAIAQKLLRTVDLKLGYIGRL